MNEKKQRSEPYDNGKLVCFNKFIYNMRYFTQTEKLYNIRLSSTFLYLQNPPNVFHLK